jgi:hypothetical protein
MRFNYLLHVTRNIFLKLLRLLLQSLVSFDFCSGPHDVGAAKWTHRDVVDGAACAMQCYQFRFQFLGESSSPQLSSKPRLLWIAEAVSGYLATIASFRAKQLNGNTVFLYVSDRARRMVVAIGILQLLRGDESVLEDVVNYRFRALGFDGFAQLDERWRKPGSRSSRALQQSQLFGGAARVPATQAQLYRQRG